MNAIYRDGAEDAREFKSVYDDIMSAFDFSSDGKPEGTFRSGRHDGVRFLFRFCAVSQWWQRVWRMPLRRKRKIKSGKDLQRRIHDVEVLFIEVENLRRSDNLLDTEKLQIQCETIDKRHGQRRIWRHEDDTEIEGASAKLEHEPQP